MFEAFEGWCTGDAFTRLFQDSGAAATKFQLPMVERRTGGTTGWWLDAEWRARQL